MKYVLMQMSKFFRAKTFLFLIAFSAVSSTPTTFGSDLYGDPLVETQIAAQFGKMAKLRAWIDEYPDIVNRGDRLGYRPLHYAALGNQPEAIKFLVSQGAEVDARNKDQGTPLYAAALHGNLEAAKMLVRLGADPNTHKNNLGDHGQSVLGAAAQEGDLELVKFLISKGATVIYHGGRGKDTALHWAAWGDIEYRDGKSLRLSNEAIIDLLVKRIGNINIRNWSGDTPLHEAAKMGAVATVRHILETYPEADPTIQDQYGNTPLHEALDRAIGLPTGEDRATVVDLLVAYGAKLNASNDRGRTPIELARELNNPVVLKQLGVWSAVEAPKP